MSQQIRVLQCAECHSYQLDIVKKSPKWQCKICNAKQLVQREIMRGTGGECRTKVQELNMTHAELKRAALVALENNENVLHSTANETPKSNKWAAYVDTPVESTHFERSSSDCNTEKLVQFGKTNWQSKPTKRTSLSQYTNEVPTKKARSKWDNYD